MMLRASDPLVRAFPDNFVLADTPEGEWRMPIDEVVEEQRRSAAKARAKRAKEEATRPRVDPGTSLEELVVAHATSSGGPYGGLRSGEVLLASDPRVLAYPEYFMPLPVRHPGT
jgi:hypothetical protein